MYLMQFRFMYLREMCFIAWPLKIVYNWHFFSWILDCGVWFLLGWWCYYGQNSQVIRRSCHTGHPATIASWLPQSVHGVTGGSCGLQEISSPYKTTPGTGWRAQLPHHRHWWSCCCCHNLQQRHWQGHLSWRDLSEFCFCLKEISCLAFMIYSFTVLDSNILLFYGF